MTPEQETDYLQRLEVLILEDKALKETLSLLPRPERNEGSCVVELSTDPAVQESFRKAAAQGADIYRRIALIKLEFGCADADFERLYWIAHERVWQEKSALIRRSYEITLEGVRMSAAHVALIAANVGNMAGERQTGRELNGPR